MDTILIARTIFNGFIKYHEGFQSITKGAKYRFEKRQWDLQRKAVNNRILIHDAIIEETLINLSAYTNFTLDQFRISTIVDQFVSLTSSFPNRGIAYSFCISILRTIYPIDFPSTLWGAIMKRYESESTDPNVKYIQGVNNLVNETIEILTGINFTINFRNLSSTAIKIEKFLNKSIPNINQRIGFNFYRELFFRNEHAYLVGSIYLPDKIVPFALAFENHEDGIIVDACLISEEEIKNIFAFSRSYLQIQSENPEALVKYLSLIMPSKQKAQLYINLGYQEHGKELLLLDMYTHWAKNKEKFEYPLGIKGTVMMVFTLPSQDSVFKILRDNFGFNKDVSHEEVMQKYKFIALHDRAGRLVDTQYFARLAFPISAFNQDLLSDLTKNGGKSVKIVDEQVVITNIYMERKLIPLNVFIEKYEESESLKVVSDLGNCIKELALTNIFPGDILNKNFGVTAERKVIFYDYDEIMELSKCNFHEMPIHSSDEEVLRAESTQVILPTDIFPEELITFLMPKGIFREKLLKDHWDLFKIQFWKDSQEQNAKRIVNDLKPYVSNL